MQVVRSWSNEKCLPPKSIGYEFKYGNQSIYAHDIRDNGVYQLPLSDHTKREFMCIKYDFFI